MIFFKRGSGPRDPAFGLSYNSINESYRISKRIFEADIARTPVIVTNDLNLIDVQAKAYQVNYGRRSLDKQRKKFGGERV